MLFTITLGMCVVVIMIRIILICSCLCVLSLAALFANKIESSDLILTQIVSTVRKNIAHY